MLPLNEQIVESEESERGVKETIPALHPSRTEPIGFVAYLPPPFGLEDRASWEEWTERLRFIEEDLHKLLQLPHDKFWCQAVFDEKLHRCLDGYLRHAPRSFDSLSEFPGDTLTVHNEIDRLVFISYLRMATHKETKENFIAPKVFGDILYENFIFDIPKLMDLCMLYGQNNSTILYKMIQNIFTQQPKYEEDLKATLPAIYQVFENILAKCGVSQEGGSGLSPQKLHLPLPEQPLVAMTTDELIDIVYYLRDTSVTVSSFLEVYPEACQAFYMAGFPQRVASFYDALIPALEATIKSRSYPSPKQKTSLRRNLQQSRRHLIQSYHQILQVCCVQPILDSSKYRTQQSVEALLDVFSQIQGDRRFLADYESQHPFQDFVDILTQAECFLDETRLQFVQDGINSSFATFGKRRKPTGAKNAGGRESPEGSAGSGDGGAAATVSMATGGQGSIKEEFKGAMGSGGSSQPEGATSRTVTGVELDSLITAIKDLLPDLGEGFIERCLEEFGYDQERVIGALLENSLPIPLRDMDRSLTRVKKEEPVDYLSERRNVFDYDEFDVMNRDTIDMSRVIQGKKEKNPVGLGVLDDKSELSSLKPLFDRYGSGVVGESVYDPDMYEDEYDDTYDTGVIGADDADSADELSTRKAFTTPRILEKPQRSGQREEDSDGEDSSEQEGKKDEFVTNPALLRAKAAERAQSRVQRDANRKGQGHRQPVGQGQRQDGGSQGQGQKKFDVKGKPKGQGQDTNVTRNRNYKDKHKSTVGNHNRRAMADRKRMA